MHDPHTPYERQSAVLLDVGWMRWLPPEASSLYHVIDLHGREGLPGELGAQASDSSIGFHLECRGGLDALVDEPDAHDDGQFADERSHELRCLDLAHDLAGELRTCRDYVTYLLRCGLVERLEPADQA